MSKKPLGGDLSLEEETDHTWEAWAMQKGRCVEKDLVKKTAGQGGGGGRPGKAEVCRKGQDEEGDSRLGRRLGR